MKQILASLLAAYTLTNGQTPPIEAVVTGAPIATTLAPAAIPLAAATTAATITAATTAAPAVIIPDPVIVPPPPPVDPVLTAATTTAPVPIVITPAPVTPSPTTAAPTMNQYCPPPMTLGSTHGVTSGTVMSSNQGCISPFERATAFNGKLQCSKFACCQCQEIQCGDPFGLACDELVISDSGAVGNQNINVLGDMTSAFGGNSFSGIGGAMNNGAEIRCNGLEACKASKIYGKYVGQMKCSGDMGCAGANVLLEDPGQDFQFQCAGMMSCMNMNLEIIITPNSQVMELGTIEFNGQQSAQGMTVTIINQARYPVMLQKLECMNPTACPNLRINIIGQVMIETCDLQHMNIQTAGPSLLAACQAGGQGQGNYVPGYAVPMGPQYPPQVPPQQQPPTNPGSFTPVQPTPVNPTPVNPAPVNPTPVNPTPVNPAPVNPTPYNPYNPGFGGFGFIDPQQLTCDMGACMNRRLTVTPMQHFKLICDKPGQCNGMTLNLNPMGFVEIQAMKFSVPTQGVTVNINGMAEINDIRCEVIGACSGLTINAPQIFDLTQFNMDCQQPGACMGCTFNGQDCNMLSMTQGNNNGFGAYAQYGTPYGYPQQPAAPVQPAAPYNPYPQQPAQYNPYQQPAPYNPWI